MALPARVALAGDVTQALARLVAAFGAPNVLVHNAAVMPEGTIEWTSAADWDRVFAVNVKGACLTRREVIPLMRQAGGGAILLMASITGVNGLPELAAYSATKGALIALARATAIDHAREGIRVNSVAPEVPPAQGVDELALQLRPAIWQRFIIHEGSKGPLEVEIAVRRVAMADEELPGRDEWLVLRRAIGAPLAQWKFYRSNAPANTPLTTLARMTAWHWPVETVIEECKGELDLDHYEVRGWVGWHHHTTMTLLAHHFLVRLRVNRGIEAPALTVAQVRKLLQVVLPKREFNAQAALDELARIQRQNHAAHRSHKKRRWRTRKSPTPN